MSENNGASQAKIGRRIKAVAINSVGGRKLHAIAVLLSFLGFLCLLVMHFYGSRMLTINNSTTVSTPQTTANAQALLVKAEVWAGAGVSCVLASVVVKICSVLKDKRPIKKTINL